jgi:hypothetical protein
MFAYLHSLRQPPQYHPQVSDFRAKELHEKIFFALRWVNPPLSSALEKLLLEYCDHLMGPEPDTPFPQATLLAAWKEKYRATQYEKAFLYISSLCSRMKSIVTRRDKGVVQTHEKMETTSTRITFRKEANLRWEMERLKGQRDRYWTIW